MEKYSRKIFRKTKESLTWHFREDCDRFPRIYGFITKKLRLPLKFQMICAICKRLEKEEQAGLSLSNE
jgi:hypothetical protein